MGQPISNEVGRIKEALGGPSIGTRARCGLLADPSVDALAQQVGMPVVARVLLDHVYEELAQCDGLALGVRPRKPRSWPAGEPLGEADLGAPRRPRLRHDRRISPRAVQVAVGVWPRSGIPVWHVLAGKQRRNQPRSTSAMCRTRPSSDIVDGSTARRASCPASGPRTSAAASAACRAGTRSSSPARPPAAGRHRAGRERGSRNLVSPMFWMESRRERLADRNYPTAGAPPNVRGQPRAHAAANSAAEADEATL